MTSARQSGIPGPVMRGPLLVLMVGLALGVVGCGSIYRRTQALLPPEPEAQLALSVEAARRAEKSAAAASEILNNRLAQGLPRDAIAPDLDRLETAALELQRRVVAAQEAAGRGRAPVQVTDEIERLHQRARELLERVASLRRAGTSTNAGLPNSMPKPF